MSNEEKRLKRNAYMRDYQKKWVARMSPEEKTEWNAHREALRRLQPKAPFNEKARAFRLKRRLAAIAAYGGSCVCCGEDEPLFLTFDHIVPIRRADRRSGRDSGHGMVLKLRKTGYPKDFQILCFNCNHAKGVESECPHTRLIKEKLNVLRIVTA